MKMNKLWNNDVISIIMIICLFKGYNFLKKIDGQGTFLRLLEGVVDDLVNE